MKIDIDRSSSPILASNTKKREGKAMESSLRFFFDLVIVVIIAFAGAVPSTWAFHS
jgi:hypothetical protein